MTAEASKWSNFYQNLKSIESWKKPILIQPTVGAVGMIPLDGSETVLVRVPEIVPVRVPEIVPARVPEMVPLLVPDIVPDFAKEEAESAKTNIAAHATDLAFFIVLLL